MFDFTLHHPDRLSQPPMRPAPAIESESSQRHRSHGAPSVLLDWAEVQLGLASTPVTRIERIEQYRRRFERCRLAVAARSHDVDPLSTAAVLLERRDQLRLAGWPREGSLPKQVRDSDPQTEELEKSILGDLIRLEAVDLPLAPSTAERIDAVLHALDRGWVLPAHRVTIDEPLSRWPFAWRQLLEKLETREVGDPPPRGPVERRLRWVQDSLFSSSSVAAPRGTEFDASVLALRASSIDQACRWITVQCATDRDLAARTVIVCENDRTAQRLDVRFAAAGLPTMGTSRRSSARPTLQVLPLALDLCWSPPDPQRVLDLLTLPIGPIPHRAARPLVDALAESPGLGSEAWIGALRKVTDPEHDPEGKIAARLSTWLEPDAHPRGSSLPASLVAERAALVEGWARRYAAAVRDREDDLARELETAAQQAALLARLAAEQDDALTASFNEPRLERLLDEVHHALPSRAALPRRSGAPYRVREFAEWDAPIEQVIWLGTGTNSRSPDPWSLLDRELLEVHQIDLAPAELPPKVRQRATKRALARVGRRFVTVTLPEDTERRPHPLLLAMESVIGRKKTSVRALLHATQDTDAKESFEAQAAAALGMTSRTVEVTPHREPPTVWSVPGDLLHDRELHSATELEDRVACPLKWTFKYGAKLRRSRAAELPDGARLAGNFLHAVLDEAFTPQREGEPIDPNVEATLKRVTQLFHERLDSDAAPLAQPAAAGERLRLERQLRDATRTLVGTLVAGGYRVVAMEEPIAKGTTVDGLALTGAIDCRVVDADGREAIIDFKYGRAVARRASLADGRAIQLATYAASRFTDGEPPAVAYLILTSGELFTPAGSELTGASPDQRVEGGPPIGDVWSRFIATLSAADTWLTSGDIPVRPLQSTDQWPLGADLALDATATNRRDQPVCRYCDFTTLCGREAAR